MKMIAINKQNSNPDKYREKDWSVEMPNEPYTNRCVEFHTSENRD